MLETYSILHTGGIGTTCKKVPKSVVPKRGEWFLDE